MRIVNPDGATARWCHSTCVDSRTRIEGSVRAILALAAVAHSHSRAGVTQLNSSDGTMQAIDYDSESWHADGLSVAKAIARHQLKRR